MGTGYSKGSHWLFIHWRPGFLENDVKNQFLDLAGVAFKQQYEWFNINITSPDNHIILYNSIHECRYYLVPYMFVYVYLLMCIVQHIFFCSTCTARLPGSRTAMRSLQVKCGLPRLFTSEPCICCVNLHVQGCCIWKTDLLCILYIYICISRYVYVCRISYTYQWNHL